MLRAAIVISLASIAHAQGLTPEEANRLIPEAAGLDARTWKAISEAPEPPTVRSFRSYPLTALFILQPWVHDRTKGAEFCFLGDTLPSPAQLAPGWERSLERDFVSVVQAEDLSEVVVESAGDEAHGTCAFEVKGMYRGKLRFAAARRGGSWALTRVDWPALGLRTRRAEDGSWMGSAPLLSAQWLRARLAGEFRLAATKADFAGWRKLGIRPRLEQLRRLTPGMALLTDVTPVTGEAWRFLDTSDGGLPPLRLLEEKNQLGVDRGYGLVAPTDLRSLTIEAAGKAVEEVDAASGAKTARGSFTIAVDGLMEGGARYEARYESPSHLPRGLEGAWVLTRIELPGLNLAFELNDDLSTWRTKSSR